MKRTFVLTLFLPSFFLACSTINPDGYLSARTDQDFSFHRSRPVYVVQPEPQTVKNKEFRQLLITELRQVGLAVNDELTQDTLLLFFKYNDESQNIVLIPGNPGLSRLPAQWQEIHLELYSLQDVKESKPVWKGYLKVRIKNFNAQPGDSIRPLLELVGKNYEGPTPITVYTKDQSAPTQDEIERLEKKVKSLEEKIEEMQSPPSSPTASDGESPNSGESP